MANATLNETLVNATAAAQGVDVATAVGLFFTVLIPEILSRLFVFVAAPFLYPEMWWLLIHLILTFVLFEFYFERHEDEDLGWTAALANSVVMVFVAMDLLRSLYNHSDSPFVVLWQVLQDYFSLGFFSDQMVLVSLVLLLGVAGLATAFINYYHVLPRRLAFLVSGHKTVNLLAYFLIVAVYRFTHSQPLPLDGVTLTSLALFGALLWSLLFYLLHKRHKKRAQKTQFTPFK